MFVMEKLITCRQLYEETNQQFSHNFCTDIQVSLALISL